MSELNFDPSVEDPERLRALTRRGFLGMAGAIAATPGLAGTRAPAAPALAEVADLGRIPRGPAPDDEPAWTRVASDFLLRGGLAYMNTGTRGPSPRYLHERQVQSLAGINADYLGYTRNVHTDEFSARLRRKVGALFGAKESEIALMNNTTDGMITGTWGPVLQPGDEIVYTNHDHSGGAHPILHRVDRDDLAVKVIDLADPKYHPASSPDDYLKVFEAALTARTRLLSFCHINYGDGAVLPVQEICEMARERGVLTLVDGAQPPGMMKLDLHDLGCDMYAGPFHKWMLGSMYTGFFYVREDVLDRIEPVLTSMPPGRTLYDGPVSEKDAKLLAAAAKFEKRGSVSISSRMAMDAAIDYHDHLGVEAIEARDRYLAAKLRAGLRATDGVDVFVSDDPRMSCALVSFVIRGVKPTDLNDMLWERHDIYIRNVTHPEIQWDVNRASMHVMVTAAQVDTLLGAIEEIARRTGA